MESSESIVLENIVNHPEWHNLVAEWEENIQEAFEKYGEEVIEDLPNFPNKRLETIFQVFLELILKKELPYTERIAKRVSKKNIGIELAQLLLRLEREYFPHIRTPAEGLERIRSLSGLNNFFSLFLDAPLIGREQRAGFINLDLATRTVRAILERVVRILTVEPSYIEKDGVLIPGFYESDFLRAFVGNYGKFERDHLQEILSVLGLYAEKLDTEKTFYCFSEKTLNQLKNGGLAYFRGDRWVLQLGDRSFLEWFVVRTMLNRLQIGKDLVFVISSLFAGMIYVYVPRWKLGLGAYYPKAMLRDEIVLLLVPSLIKLCAFVLGGKEWLVKLPRGEKFRRRYLQYVHVIQRTYVKINQGSISIRETPILQFIGGLYTKIMAENVEME